jgi:hypothetical protein
MGKKYTHDKDVYVIYIRASSNTNFYRYVGFTIRRKQRRLENYVERTTRMPTPPPTISQPILKIITNTGPAGFEPATSGLKARRSSCLSYGPTLLRVIDVARRFLSLYSS